MAELPDETAPSDDAGRMLVGFLRAVAATYPHVRPHTATYRKGADHLNVDMEYLPGKMLACVVYVRVPSLYKAYGWTIEGLLDAHLKAYAPHFQLHG